MIEFFLALACVFALGIFWAVIWARDIAAAAKWDEEVDRWEAYYRSEQDAG